MPPSSQPSCGASLQGAVEVLATAGLGYILEQSAECRQSLQALVDACGASVSADLDYRTQATGDDAAIPDLVGTRPGAGPELIIEGKFWAGLTANQPCTYLKRLQVGSARLPPLRGPIRPHGDAVAEAEGRVRGVPSATRSDAGEEGAAQVAGDHSGVRSRAGARLLAARAGRVRSSSTGSRQPRPRHRHPPVGRPL